jgi:hypothetical protein
MQAELALASALGYKATIDRDVDRLELLPGERIAEYVLEERGPNQVLFSEYGAQAYTWLSASRSADGESVTLYIGVSLAGQGYKGIPLTTYMLYQLAQPLRGLYARALLRAAADKLRTDVAAQR